MDEMIELIAEDAQFLGCEAEVERARTILSGGTAADRQRAVYQDSVQAEKPKEEALRDVVRHLVDSFHDGL